MTSPRTIMLLELHFPFGPLCRRSRRGTSLRMNIPLNTYGCPLTHQISGGVRSFEWSTNSGSILKLFMALQLQLRFNCVSVILYARCTDNHSCMCVRLCCNLIHTSHVLLLPKEVICQSEVYGETAHVYMHGLYSLWFLQQLWCFP